MLPMRYVPVYQLLLLPYLRDNKYSSLLLYVCMRMVTQAAKMFAEGVDKFMHENDIHKHTYERDKAKVSYQKKL